MWCLEAALFFAAMCDLGSTATFIWTGETLHRESHEFSKVLWLAVAVTHFVRLY